MRRSFFAPSSLEEAVRLLAEHPKARPVAGGTDLVVGARQGKRALPEALVAIHGLEELRGLHEERASLFLGALATHGNLEESPLVRERWTALADAASLVGSPATRHVGTVGGNLINGSPAMELGSPLLVLGAEVELRGPAGARSLAVRELLVGPGETAAAGDELVTRVRMPSLPSRAGSGYVRLEYRRAMEIAVVGAAALIALTDDGTVGEARVALTAVAPTCVRCPEAEEALRGRELSDETLAEAAALAAGSASPIGDVRATELYRRALVPVIARRALEAAARRARGEFVAVPASRSVGPLAEAAA